MEIAKAIMPEVEYMEDPYLACDSADCVVILTEWNEYRSLDIDKIKKLLKTPIFIDLRNIYDPQMLKEKGFKYTGVGRN